MFIEVRGDKHCLREGSEEEPGEDIACYDTPDAAAAALAEREGAGEEVAVAEVAPPVGPIPAGAADPTGRVLEAIGDEKTKRTGARWDVVLIEEGVSANGRLWTREQLTDSRFLAMLEGQDSFEDHDSPEQEAQYPVRRVGEHTGYYSNVRPVQDPVTGKVAVRAIWNVIREDWRQRLLNALDMGALDRAAQFSVNARGTERPAIVNGQRVMVPDEIKYVRGIDNVVRASAGGRVVALVEAGTRPAIDAEARQMTQEEVQAAIAAAMADPETMRAALAAAGVPVPVEESAEDTGAPAPEAAAEAAEPEEPTTEPEATLAAAPAAITEALAAVQAMRAEIEAQAAAAANERIIEAALRDSNLPRLLADQARARLTEAAGVARLDEGRATAIVGEYRTIAEAFASRQPETRAAVLKYSGGEGPQKMFALRMLSTLGARGQLKEIKEGHNPGRVTDDGGEVVQPFTSLRQAWCAFHPEADPWAGDMGMRIWEGFRTPFRGAQSHARITEALTTATFAEITQDAMYVMMLRHYEALPYDGWRRVVSTIEPAADFRARNWTRIGGYTDDLSVVGENATYPALTHGGDEEITYAVQKRGGMEDTITLELIANDQIGALARLPQRLADVAGRTLYKFVFNTLIFSNPTLDYDAVALFDNAHGNTNTLAPSVSAMNTVVNAMEGQAPRLAGADVLGVMNRPAMVIGPRQLAGVFGRILNPSDAYAYGLTPAATTPGANVDTDANLDPHMFKGSGIEYITNEFASSSTAWVAVADPARQDTIVMGFYGGRQEPELFIQDDPSQGITFDRDAQAMKLRHIYGGDNANHTSFYRGNV